MIPGTWLKWRLFGDASRKPVYVFFVGHNYSCVGDCYLFTTPAGRSFYADERLLNRFDLCDASDVIPALSEGVRRNAAAIPHEDGRKAPSKALAAGATRPDHPFKAAAKPEYAKHWVPWFAGDYS